jgi:hypothetical protein
MRTDAGDRRRWGWLFVVSYVCLLGAHRLSFFIGTAALGVVALVALAGNRRQAPRGLVLLGLPVLLLAIPTVMDLRSRGGGGYQSYKAYLLTKLDWSFVLRDLSWFAVALGAAALALVLRAKPFGKLETWLPIGLLVAVIAYGYSWVLHVPGFYNRASYYLPVVLALVLAAGTPLALRAVPTRIVVAVFVVALTLTGASAASRAGEARDFYRIADRAALRGIAYLKPLLQPGDVVVTDRCWSFMGAWLVHVPMIAAMDPEDIGPAAEVPLAREARAIFRGGPAGRATARRVRARWLLQDPSCPAARRPQLNPPAYAQARFLSYRLAIYRLQPERG